MCRKTGSVTRKRWDEGQDALLSDLHRKYTIPRIATIMTDRTPQALTSRVHRLGLKRGKLKSFLKTRTTVSKPYYLVNSITMKSVDACQYDDRDTMLEHLCAYWGRDLGELIWILPNVFRVHPDSNFYFMIKRGHNPNRKFTQ
jgi:hypothetical protein